MTVSKKVSRVRRASAAPSSGALNIGDPAPAWTLPTDTGESVSLASRRGKTVILYFYPKDDTPGCTKEACAFRDASDRVRALGACVFGISVDSVAAHRAFKAKYRLPFPLLSDADKTVVRAYGVWKEKSMYGRTYWGIERTTVVINPQGRITRIFPKVKVDGHVDEVLAVLGTRSR